MKTIIFDTETNGLNKNSVLSFSALVLDEKDNIIEEIDRYYFRNPNEKINIEAINVNGLTDEVIIKKRKNCNYSQFFKDDIEILKKINTCDVLVCHNANFDLTQVEHAFNCNFKHKNIICTMRATQYLYNAPYYKFGEPKYPKLSESLEYYNIDVEKLKKKLGLDFHNSLFDVYCTYELYLRIKSDRNI